MNSPQENIDNHSRAIAIKVIKCLEELIDLSEDNISIESIVYNNPKYISIIVKSKEESIGINIHKVK